MMANFTLRNRNRLAELFRIETEKPTTGALIEYFKENRDKLNFTYSIVIRFLVYQALRNMHVGDDINKGSSILEFISLNSSEFSKLTGLKMPLKVPHSSTLLVLVALFIIILFSVFYLLIEFTNQTLPIIIFMGIGFVFPISILMWGLFLKIFKRTFGKQNFAGVTSLSSLIDEIINDNETVFSHAEFSFLNESLQKIDLSSDEDYNKWRIFDSLIFTDIGNPARADLQSVP